VPQEQLEAPLAGRTELQADSVGAQEDEVASYMYIGMKSRRIPAST